MIELEYAVGRSHEETVGGKEAGEGVCNCKYSGLNSGLWRHCISIYLV